MPAVDRLAELWGDLVAACPFCHGHEAAGRRVGILGAGAAGHQTTLLAPVAASLTVFSHEEDEVPGLGGPGRHALVAAHGQVYGYDSTSGTFMVTGDKKEWDRRSRLPMLGFAVDPADPEMVVAATPDGPVLSPDGGRTWAQLADAPPLAVVATRAAGGAAGAVISQRLAAQVARRSDGRGHHGASWPVEDRNAEAPGEVQGLWPGASS